MYRCGVTSKSNYNHTVIPGTPPSSPQLRLLYECCPMAYIIEQAGGKSTNGTIPTLDITPKTIHDRAPIFIGSTDNVDDFLRVKEEIEKKSAK